MSIVLNEILSKEKLEKAYNHCIKKVDFAMESFKGGIFPFGSSENNIYKPTGNIDNWIQGFWSGMLWISYELTDDKKYKDAALLQIPSYTKRITERLGVNHHDMGFLYTPSCVAAYKLAGDEEAKKAALLAADNLVSRYHEKGNFIQAWGPLGSENNYRLIIDCLLNIPLLFWVSEVTGNKKYSEIAIRHFNTTADNIMRPDGSTYHTFYFDKETGLALRGATAQGAGDNSCWARGQAWGIYGMMLTEAYCHTEKAIPQFKKICDYFINYLPKDCIPFWDMIFTDGDEEPRDSSAAAIAICGILEACKFLPDKDKEKYLPIANKMMASLIDGYLSENMPECNGILLHSTNSKPDGIGVDECTIWGDYFFMEALIRFMTDNKWTLYW